MTIDINLYKPNSDKPANLLTSNQPYTTELSKTKHPLFQLFQSKYPHNTLHSLILFTNTLYMTYETNLTAYFNHYPTDSKTCRLDYYKCRFIK